jgi:hypothetical protein
MRRVDAIHRKYNRFAIAIPILCRMMVDFIHPTVVANIVIEPNVNGGGILPPYGCCNIVIEPNAYDNGFYHPTYQ